MENYCIGANLGIVADGYVAKDFGAGTDQDVVAHGGMTLDAGRSAQSAQGGAMEDRHVIADNGGFADDHAHPMIDEGVLTNDCAGVDLNTGAVS